MDSLNLSPYFTTIQCSKVKIHVSLFLHSCASILYLSLFTLVLLVHHEIESLVDDNQKANYPAITVEYSKLLKVV